MMELPHTTEAADRPNRRWVASGLLGVLLLVLSVAFFRHVAVTLAFPYPVEYGEGVLLNWAQRLARGRQLYPLVSSETLPWLHNPYGPLWYWLAVPLTGIFDDVFTAARLISLAAFLACCFFLYRLCRRDLGVAGALLVNLLFAASPLVWRYALMARVDMTALAFSLGALLLMEREQKSSPDVAGRPTDGALGSGVPAWFLAGVMAAAALLIKPLFIAPLLTGAVAGIGDWPRKAAPFGMGLLVLLLAAGAWLWWGGESGIYHHFGRMNRIGVSVPLLVRLTLESIGRHPFVALALLLGLWKADRARPRYWFALFMLIMFLGGMKRGADAHYFLGPLSGAVLMATHLSRTCRSTHATHGMKHPVLFLWLLAAQLALYLPVAPQPVFTATYGQEVPTGHSALTPGESDREIGALLVGEMSGTDGPVLADDPGYVLAAGKTLMVQPYQYGRLVESGRVDPQGLKDRIQDGYFDLIVLRDEQPAGPAGSDLPTAVVESIEQYYHMHREIGPYKAYLPAHR